tara:strand:- start:321 stop:569 length:249 start_codon:yes stop_codon:yes gene_type:complete
MKIIDKKVFKSLDLKSKTFSIETEIMSKLACAGALFHEIEVEYNRRKNNEGKKLKISDGWSILWTMFLIKIKYRHKVFKPLP